MRSAELNFLHDIVAPVTQFNKNGFLARVGRGSNSVVKFFKVHVLNISGDGELLDALAGANCKRVNRNCRSCMDVATSRLLMPGEDRIEYRSDHSHELAVKRMGALMKKFVLERRRFSETDKVWKRRTNSLCITPGLNPLYRLFYYFNGKGITSFHRSLYPDRLHVIFKGIVEKTIAWTLAIVYDVMKLFPAQYARSMSIIDERTSAFPDHQAFEFYRCGCAYKPYPI